MKRLLIYSSVIVFWIKMYVKFIDRFINCFLNKVIWLILMIKKSNEWDFRQFPMKIITVVYVLCLLVAQSCLPLCNPMDCSPPSWSVHAILQARTLEWVTTLFFRESSSPRNLTHISYIASSLLHCRQILYWLSHQRSQSGVGFLIQ